MQANASQKGRTFISSYRSRICRKSSKRRVNGRFARGCRAEDVFVRV